MKTHPFLLRGACIVVVALILLPANSFGWIDTGHEIIASIAYDELTPAARKAADELLKQHPRYDKDLLAGMPAGFDSGRYAFMIAATWPDVVRSPANPMHFVANHPAWHYIDIPYMESGYMPTTRPATAPGTATASTKPGSPHNILEALAKVTADVHDASLSPQDRAIALCWILHLGGDLHQPLHAAELFSAKFPNGDRGGNSELVLRIPHQTYSQVNLHSLWDQMLGTYRSPDMIVRMAGGLRNDPQFTREKLAESLKMHDFASWAKESHDLAITDVYLNGKLETATMDESRDEHRRDIPSVPEGYLAEGEEIAARRAMLAGYRIADLLNTRLVPASNQ